MAFVLMIPREGRMHARHWRQIRRRGRDRLDARFLSKETIATGFSDFFDFSALRRLFQDLDLAIDTQNFRHLVLELGIAAFQIVAHLVRLDFLLTENLHTVPCTRWARQSPCRCILSLSVQLAAAIKSCPSAAPPLTRSDVDPFQVRAERRTSLAAAVEVAEGRRLRPRVARP